jgi:NAD(P)-dependent dehydrogenase (short-subunit alcohol dehydrogenase family)
MNQDRRLAVVTGASSGVGRATVIELARSGFNVALLARESSRLLDAQREAESLGVSALALPVDVADADQVEQAAVQVERELGEIDVWVNNAMTTIFAPFHEVTPDEFRRATEVTYLGTVFGTMSALRRMRARNAGTIVQVGSALAYRAIPLQSAYCGAKHAIRGFTDSIRCELLHDQRDVHITMVQLPALNTPQFNWCRSRLPNHPQPVPPIFQPEVAARAIVWAAQHRKREVIVGRTSWITIWGNKFLPSVGDHYLAANGYQGQQTDMPVPSDRPNNLFEPVEADYGAHGIFDERAEATSWQFELEKRGGAKMAAAGLVAGGLIGLWLSTIGTGRNA